MWNMAASSAAESRSGRAKKLRAKTSKARCRAAFGKVDLVQEGARIAVVELLVDTRYRHRRQGAAALPLIRTRSRNRKVGAAQSEDEGVPGRGLRQPAEGVAPALAVYQWVILHRTQPRQAGIAAPQQLPQVVVLAEEGVEAAIVNTSVPASGPDSTRSVPRHPAAEVGLALENLDGDTAFGQSGGGGKPAIPAPTTTT